MMRFVRALLVVLLLSIAYFAEADTIKMMQYNLMYYTDNAPEGCNDFTNHLDKKDTCLKAIFKYLKPDVIGVNEIGKYDVYANRLLTNTLNVDGVDYYDFCPTVSNSTGITIGNRLFYDTRKLTFVESYYFPTGLTYFNCYRFYFNTKELKSGDTTYVTFIVTHLKAGSYEENLESRYEQVKTFIAQLRASGRHENFILSGDFNIGNDTEDAFQLLIDNGDYNFIDPIRKEGDWHDNPEYAAYHTQSTHAGYESDICFSGGGFDNRYDIILVSPQVYYGTEGVKALESSYTTVGQDGNRLNKGLLYPANTRGVPENVLNALYNSSDHLPVTMELEISGTAVGVSGAEAVPFHVNVENPVANGKLRLSVFSPQPELFRMEIFTIDGKLLDSFSQSIHNQQNIEIDFPYSKGIYMLRISSCDKKSIVRKIVKM